MSRLSGSQRLLRRLRVIAVAAVVAVLAGAVLASGSSATTYTYCDGCTINSHIERLSAANRHAYISYVHRLSGPSSSEIWASAYTDPFGSTLVCRSIAYSVTEVSCNPGFVAVYGGAYNGGAGNYGFNAHLGY